MSLPPRLQASDLKLIPNKESESPLITDVFELYVIDTQGNYLRIGQVQVYTAITEITAIILLRTEASKRQTIKNAVEDWIRDTLAEIGIEADRIILYTVKKVKQIY
jgi:hypothetical protein